MHHVRLARSPDAIAQTQSSSETGTSSTAHSPMQSSSAPSKRALFEMLAMDRDDCRAPGGLAS